MRELIQKTVFYDPTADYVVKGEKRKWAGLPKSKSLFYSRLGRGLPIGNLTSQLFANIYLNDFDHFVKRNLKIRYYGRYVDDMALVHQDKNHLKSIIPSLSDYLKNNLQLELHEKKIYLQHYAKGVKFLGAFIMPHRVYIDKRTKGNLHNLIRESNLLLEKQNNQIDWNQTKEFTVGLNSYLGLMGHFQTDKLQRAVIKELSVYLWNYVYMERGYLKIR